MQNEIKVRAAIELVSLEYFSQCIANGATPEQAKEEMISEAGTKTMAERIKEIIK